MRSSSGLLFAAALFLIPPALTSRVSAEEDWRSGSAYTDLIDDEVGALVKLMRAAIKAHHRRQAWYLAQRILELEADQREATQLVDRWDTMALQEGKSPGQRWHRQRDRSLERVARMYDTFLSELRASGALGPELCDLDLRAAHYGFPGAAIQDLLKADGALWLGTFAKAGDGPAVLDAEGVRALLGTHAPEVTFPAAFDDAYLRTAVRWPGAQVAVWGRWRFLTDLAAERALPLLALLADAEHWVVATMGSDADPEREITDLLFFGDLETYDAIGGEIVSILDNRRADRFRRRSSQYLYWREMLLVSSELRQASWIGKDVALLGQVAPVLARHHLSGQAGSSVRGRGAWLLDGFTGALEGFGRDEDGEGGIDAARCWRLAAARKLHETGALLPWDEFLDLDERKADDLRRRKVVFSFGGEEREADVDIAAAQATVLVLGILTADPEEGPAQIARLLHDLYRRDRLPDIDKALRWKRGTAVERARAMLEPEDS